MNIQKGDILNAIISTTYSVGKNHKTALYIK